jgi:phage terminase large subunit-like protein
MWETACLDWEKRLLAGRSLVPELPLFEEEAALAERVFNRLKLPDVIGQPCMKEAAGDWFRSIVRALFGAYDPATNRRMVQEFFLLVPKKNGKSSYAAALMVVALIVNRRPNAEYLLIAPTKEIAQIAFKQAWGIIKADPELAKLFWARDNVKMITHRNSNASLQIKAADTDVITGSKSTGILVDETHEFAKKSKAAEIFVEIRGALAARPDGFMIQITTQSKEPPTGVFKDELSIARKVRDGELKLPKLAVLYELPHAIATDGGWKNEQLWPLVNPNLHRSVDLQFLRNELTVAEETGPSQLALLASQHFNVEIGLSFHADRWAGVDFWRKAEDASITKEALMERCDVIVVGVDGGGLDDLFGLNLTGRDRDTRDWLSWTHSWCHHGVLERRKSIATRLRDFEKAGELTIVDDELEDLSEIVGIIEEIRDAGLLAAVAVDPAGLGELIEELSAIDITQDGGQVIGVPQGYAMMNAIKTAERKLANGTMRHSQSALMDWAVTNLKIEPTATAIRATKMNAGDAKIDPVMAMFDAVQVMVRNPEANGISVFERMAAQLPAEVEKTDAVYVQPYVNPVWDMADLDDM